MDDARYVSLRRQGPTPPNTYKLVMREEPFHGVRAIRLVPVGDGKMFGRDGLLAHSYMLGPNGQSNGCVSFSDYPVFLEACLKGEVDRLVVVEQLATAPGPETASAALLASGNPRRGRSVTRPACLRTQRRAALRTNGKQSNLSHSYNRLNCTFSPS